MTTLTAFILGTVFGIVTLVFLLSWAAWSAIKPEPRKPRTVVLTAYGKDALMRAIQDDLRRAKPSIGMMQ